jgi:hypothetical protein
LAAVGVPGEERHCDTAEAGATWYGSTCEVGIQVMIMLGKYGWTKQKGTNLARMLARDRFGVIVNAFSLQKNHNGPNKAHRLIAVLQKEKSPS